MSGQPTLKQRRAQSARDKQRNAINNRNNNLKPRSRRGNSGNNLSLAATTGIALRTQTSFRSGPAKYPGSMTMTGSEFLTTMTAGDGTAGQILFVQELSPSSLTGTRLKEIAGMFEKYRFTRFNIRYVSTTGTGAPGTILLSYDRDIKDVVSTDPVTRIRQLSSSQDAVQFPRWSNYAMRIQLSSPDEGYYNNGKLADADNRLSFQGRVTGVAVDGFTGASGSIWIDYEVELFIPAVETVTIAPAPVENTMKRKNFLMSLANTKPIAASTGIVDDSFIESLTTSIIGGAMVPDIVLQREDDGTAAAFRLAKDKVYEIACLIRADATVQNPSDTVAYRFSDGVEDLLGWRFEDYSGEEIDFSDRVKEAKNAHLSAMEGTVISIHGLKNIFTSACGIAVDLTGYQDPYVLAYPYIKEGTSVSSYTEPNGEYIVGGDTQVTHINIMGTSQDGDRSLKFTFDEITKPFFEQLL